MPIPELDEDGLLPAGVHDCALAEIEERFGRFRTTDRRPELFLRLQSYLKEAQTTSLLQAIIIDGSFVTGEAAPNDIDMIAVLKSDHDFRAALKPFQANIISNRHVRRHYGFDVLVAREDSVEYAEYVAFFQQIRGKPEQRKGILRITL